MIKALYNKQEKLLKKDRITFIESKSNFIQIKKVTKTITNFDKNKIYIKLIENDIINK